MSQNSDPYFQQHVFFCTNSRPDGHERGCCQSKGSVKLRNYLKARVKELGLKGIRINTAGCLDRCEHGPTVVVYPQGIWYSCGSIEDAEEIATRHLRDGGVVSHLQIPGRSQKD